MGDKRAYELSTGGWFADYPAAAVVQIGSTYNHAQETGTFAACDYPSIDDVRYGTEFGIGTYTGNLVLPTEAQTKFGVTFGTSGTEYTGNVTLPAVGDVRLSIIYGSSGIEYTGTLLISDTTALQDQIDVLRRQLANVQDSISKRSKRTDVNTINTSLSDTQNALDQQLEDFKLCLTELQNGLLAAKKLLSTHTH